MTARLTKYNGLHKQPDYEQLVDYLGNQQKVLKYPDRRATLIRNSPYLTQLDGDIGIDLETYQTNLLKEHIKEEIIRDVARHTRSSVGAVRSRPEIFNIADNQEKGSESSFNSAQGSESYDSAMSDYASFIDDEEAYERFQKHLKHKDNERMVKSLLDDVVKEAEAQIGSRAQNSSRQFLKSVYSNVDKRMKTTKTDMPSSSSSTATTQQMPFGLRGAVGKPMPVPKHLTQKLKAGPEEDETLFKSISASLKNMSRDELREMYFKETGKRGNKDIGKDTLIQKIAYNRMSKR
jgi:hypothetical protein